MGNTLLYKKYCRQREKLLLVVFMGNQNLKRNGICNRVKSI